MGLHSITRHQAELGPAGLPLTLVPHWSSHPREEAAGPSQHWGSLALAAPTSALPKALSEDVRGPSSTVHPWGTLSECLSVCLLCRVLCAAALPGNS